MSSFLSVEFLSAQYFLSARKYFLQEIAHIADLVPFNLIIIFVFGFSSKSYRRDKKTRYR